MVGLPLAGGYRGTYLESRVSSGCRVLGYHIDAKFKAVWPSN